MRAGGRVAGSALATMVAVTAASGLGVGWIAGMSHSHATRAAHPVHAALHGAGPAFAATIALAPSFHPWYALWPLILMAATTVRTDLAMAAATGAALLVLPDGGGLARFAEFRAHR
jgi:hypothetical protein